MRIYEVTAKETKPNMAKVLTALKKKLKDEGGAAGFDPLKAVAKKMNVDLTPTMLKGMSGIKQHRDGDYILETKNKPFNTLPKTINPLGIAKPIPQAPTGPDKTLENGMRIGTDKKGNRTVSGGAGKYTFKDGKLIAYATPKIAGYQEVYDLKNKLIKIPANTVVKVPSPIGGKDSEVVVTQSATYSMDGKQIEAGKTKVASGDVAMTQHPSGYQDFEFGAGGLPGDAVGYKRFKVSNDPADKGRSMSDYRDYEKHISVDPIAKRTGKNNPDADKARIKARTARSMRQAGFDKQ
jgi:hypothetical protein|tara:strand:- start:2203 stop:3084 length:882 start_codon:yes stop_codon:yes gene_type:complete